MKGSIRILVGFLVAFGAVGTLDVNPAASVLAMSAVAMVGLLVMFSGVSAIKNN